MPRTFDYRFDPPANDPLAGAATTGLGVQEIEDAVLKETLQRPGARFATWSGLAGLLAGGGADEPFRFHAPLAHAPEQRAALSALFARAVARAWLERHAGLAAFCALGGARDPLAGTAWSLRAGRTGADWLAIGAGDARPRLAAAGGSHGGAGAATALARCQRRLAMTTLLRGDEPLAIGRVAFALRWGMRGGPATSQMLVATEDLPAPPATAAFSGLAAALVRRHHAALLAGLGFPQLAAALRAIPDSDGPEADAARARAHVRLAAARSTFVEGFATDHLVGRVLTRGGPTTALHMTDAERRALARLRWHPQFVGIERAVLAAAIDADRSAGDPESEGAPPWHVTGSARRDRLGFWVLPLGSRLVQVAEADASR